MPTQAITPEQTQALAMYNELSAILTSNLIRAIEAAGVGYDEAHLIPYDVLAAALSNVMKQNADIVEQFSSRFVAFPSLQNALGKSQQHFLDQWRNLEVKEGKPSDRALEFYFESAATSLDTVLGNDVPVLGAVVSLGEIINEISEHKYNHVGGVVVNAITSYFVAEFVLEGIIFATIAPEIFVAAVLVVVGSSILAGETTNETLDYLFPDAKYESGEDLLSRLINAHGPEYLSNLTYNFLSGDSGANVLNGTDQPDAISGGAGNDIIFGGLNGDSLGGGSGDDSLHGEAGNDRLIGGDGDDELDGGINSDRLEGGVGFDTYRFFTADFNRDSPSQDTIIDSDGNGIITFNGNSLGVFTRDTNGVWHTGSNTFRATVTGSLGNYTLVLIHRVTGSRITVNDWSNGDLGIALPGYGEPGTPENPRGFMTNASEIFGPITVADSNRRFTAEEYRAYDGINYVSALGGNDFIDVGYGNDTAWGDSGDDFISGGAGDDRLFGGSGNDMIFDYGRTWGTYQRTTPQPEHTQAEIQTILSSVGLTNYFTASPYVIAGLNGPQTGDARGTLNSLNVYFTFGSTLVGVTEEQNYAIDHPDPNVFPSGDDIIDAGDGSDIVYAGEGNDVVDGGEGNDLLIGGHDNDIINGGEGDDLIIGDLVYANNSDTTPHDGTIPGGYLAYISQFASNTANVNGADVLSGGAGDDRIFGMGGNDRITGGSGNDVLYGDDILIGNIVYVDNPGTISGVDVIDGEEGDDEIQGGAGGDTLFGGSGNDLIVGDYVFTNPANFQSTSQGIDTIHGGEGNDHLIGAGEGDTIYGDEGDDIINGDSIEIDESYHGNDSLFGGAGNDDISGNGGDDVVHGNVGNDLIHGNTGNDFLEGDDGEDQIAGDEGNDYINGGSGNDLIDGGEGNDILNGGLDNDQIAGGAGNDQILGDSGDDVVQGDAGNDSLSGGAGVDRLSGNEGDDELNGDDGNDFVWGGIGNDKLLGGAGNDYLDGGDGQGETGSGNDELHGGSGNDQVRGADGDDQLFGDEGNDSLNGGAGNDTMDGGAGSDTYQFSSGFGTDTIANLGATNAGNDVILFDASIDPASLIYSLGSNNSLIIRIGSSSDQLTLEGFFASGANHRISFSNGSSLQQSGVINLLETPDPDATPRVIQGTPGIDRLVGASGNDTIYGDLGNDTIIGYGGDDIIYGGPEQNTASATTDNDIIFGCDGNDTIYGLQGNDRLDGGNGNDVLIGGIGEDVLIGGAGNDTLSAGELVSFDGLFIDEGSNDLLDGGLGNDTLRGGLGNNVYRFEQGFGQDTIHLTNSPANAGGNIYENALLAFQVGISVADISLSRSANSLVITNGVNTITVADYYIGVATLSIDFADGSTLSAAQTAQLITLNITPTGEVIRGTAGNDNLQAGVGNDEVYGLAGNDRIAGGDGNDSLFGGAGNDLLIGGNGADYLAGGIGSDAYEFDLGAGADFVGNLERSASDFDVVRLGAGITLQNLTINQSGQDLVLVVQGTDDSLRIEGYFSSNSAAQQIRFSDGTFLTSAQLWSGGNTITGTSGNDSLYGYSGNDIIYGGFGEDHLDGGDGGDLIYGDYHVSYLGDNTGINAAGNDDTIFGGAGSDEIYGQGGNDFIDGGDDADYIFAGAGNDQIDGGLGNDNIDGGLGDDQIFGGAGNDVVNGGFGSDTYVFGRGAGNDRLILEQGDTRGFYVEGSVNDIDTIQLDSSVTADDVYFVRSDNPPNSVSLMIRGARDSFEIVNFFNYGTSQVRTGAIDRVVFANGAVWDRQEIMRRLMMGSEDNDIIAPIQSVDGSPQVMPVIINAGAGDDQVTGTQGNELILGGIGNDIINGGSGDDIIDGGSGSDYLIGGLGNDIYRFGIGSGVDIVFNPPNYYSQALEFGSRDVVELGDGLTPENVTLIRAGDHLVIDLGNNNDRLFIANFYNYYGQERNPISELRFSNGVVWDTATIANNVTETNGALTFGHSNYGGSSLSNFAYLLSARSGDVLEGLPSESTYFNAGAGDDLMVGGIAADRFVFGRNFDRDIILDNGGLDQIGFIDGINPSEVSIGRAGNDLLLSIGNFEDYITVRNFFSSNNSEIENVTFDNGVHWDTEYLRANAAVLDLQLAGSAGNDSLVGSNGNDLLQGGIGNDLLIGNGGDDFLDGGIGADTMRGGAGSDTYIVDNLNDVVIETATNAASEHFESPYRSIDTVRSSVSYTLHIELENLELAGTEAISGTGNWRANVITGNSGSNILTGNEGNDTLLGGSGDDILNGGEGSDLLDGGVGSDVMNGGEGNDTYFVDDANDVVNDFVFEIIGDEGEGSEFDPNGSGVDANAGNDTVISSIDYQLGRFLENLTLTGNAALSGAGNELENIITGNAGNNALTGNGGDDTLIGGLGNDQLSGGVGSDTYLFARGDGIDVINDLSLAGSSDIDVLRFAADIDTTDISLARNGNDLLISLNAAGGSLVVTNYFLVSNSERLNAIERIEFANGTVWTPADVQARLFNEITGTDSNNTINGTAAADWIRGLAGADTLRGLDGDDLLDGGADNDRLEGGNGNDRLIGGEGNDNLIGGLGADTMIGGIGNDSYAVDNNDDLVTEGLDEGTDTVNASISYTLTDNFENLTLTGAESLNATGNALNNRITGNAGINILDGAGGNDTLIGGASNDTLIGGEGNDNLNGGVGADVMRAGVGNDIYAVDELGDAVIELVGEGTDTVNSSITYTLGENLENLTLTGVATINGSGNSLDNRITGNASDNTLIGAEGNDTLIGGLGVDTLIGGLGNDSYTVDNSADVVTELASEGTDTVNSSVTYTLGANLENLTLTGTDAINASGNSLDNRITGNASDNTLIGGEGNDTLIGGLGADTLIGGLGSDSYTVDNIADVLTELVGEGTDTVNSSVTYTLGANLENLTLTGTDAINGTGNALDNRLTGNAGENILSGGDGNDTLSGASGNDSLLGGAGNDALNGGAGDDQMAGGAGNDTYTVDSIGDVVSELADEGVDQVNASVSFVSTNNIENITLTGTANINVVGNALANRLTGNAGDNQLDGGDGIDTISGAAGNDVLIGGAGDDVLSGGTGANTLLGGTGNDRMSSDAASSGGSIYEGGVGNDTIIGGQQNDTYRFNIGDGKDVITDKGLAGFTDIISFGAGITSSMLQFTRMGNNLVIGVNGNTDTITISSWYTNTANQIEQILFADGNSLNTTQLQALTGGTVPLTTSKVTTATTLSVAETDATTTIATATSIISPEENFMTRLLNEHRFSNQSLLDQIQTLNDLVRPGHSSTGGWIDGSIFAPVEASDVSNGEMAVGSLTAPGSASNIGNGGSTHSSEVTPTSTGHRSHGAAWFESRLAAAMARETSNRFAGERHRFHEQELGLLIESMSQFGSQNTAVDSNLKPVNGDHLQPIVIVAPGI
jgi:trimeric autotransporter adhesin